LSVFVELVSVFFGLVILVSEGLRPPVL